MGLCLVFFGFWYIAVPVTLIAVLALSRQRNGGKTVNKSHSNKFRF